MYEKERGSREREILSCRPLEQPLRPQPAHWKPMLRENVFNGLPHESVGRSIAGCDWLVATCTSTLPLSSPSQPPSIRRSLRLLRASSLHHYSGVGYVLTFSGPGASSFDQVVRCDNIAKLKDQRGLKEAGEFRPADTTVPGLDEWRSLRKTEVILQ